MKVLIINMRGKERIGFKMELYVREFGQNQDESIVFIHGGGLSGWMWDRQVKDFSDFHCLVPDLPEHGKSVDVTPFSIKNSAEQISELIRSRAHGGKAHIVGHSIGAQILVQMLQSSPEVVDHAVVNSALTRTIRGMTSLIKPTVKLTIPLTRAKWFAKLQSKTLSVPDVYFDSYYNESKSITADSLERILLENANFNLSKELKFCTVPTLILVGQKEKGIMLHSAKDLAALMPNSKGYVVRGVGHSFSFEAPERYSSIIHAWITDKELLLDQLDKI
jgi:pimeloyl-ACP methyl ester carboxylesterase